MTSFGLRVGLSILCWVLVAAALAVALLGRAYSRSGDSNSAIAAARVAIAFAVVAMVFGAFSFGIYLGESAGSTPSPSCAQHVDLPDSDPPRYGVCVPPEEAG